jgi:predicted signal transduction protein with EAL and GGDEF domain
MSNPLPATALPWHRRLEARVTTVLGLITAGALGALLLVTLDAVARQSKSRAAAELEVARTTFHSQLASRAAATRSALQLVTRLPVFRAHLVGWRLANDRATIEAMADGYRADLAADFLVVTSPDGEWVAAPWLSADEPGRRLPDALQGVVDLARQGQITSVVVPRGDDLFLAVSMPARFADQMLAILTAGFRITDALASELARLAHCEVVVLNGSRVAATSLAGAPATEVRRLAVDVASAGLGVHEALYRLGTRQFVAGTFALQTQETVAGSTRLVVLADWQPTERFIAALRARFLGAGLIVFAVGLAGGLALSRGVSRPLRDIAEAAARITDGDLSLKLPEQGSAEATAVARAFNDMSAGLREARDRLIHDAIHDHLTLLPNRVLLMERLDRAMAHRARHPDYQFAVLFLDVDRFKCVNDSLGHDAGDRLLLAFAERLASAVRHDDVVTRVTAPAAAAGPHTLARFGGDEFVILLDDIREPIGAVRVAERVQRELAVPFKVAGQDVFATVSIGVAVSSSGHRTGGDVVRDADLAMHRAKEAGGGSYAVFDDRMHDAAVERLHLETSIRQAIERGEFGLWYQPIVSLSNQTLAGFEALIRWRHPTRGLLPPGAFLGAAEQMGVMALIDEWALREACRQARAWQLARPDEEPLTVSVNLSHKAFGLVSLVSRVADALRTTGLPAAALRLEVTETIAIADPIRTAAILTDLRALGVRISLDDFGTGYSSLSYLQQLPVDTIKIDRSFVARIGQGDGRSEIIKLIVSLSKTLGLEIVAEGAETAEQVAYLAAVGCGFGQGYFFGPPRDADTVAVALAERSNTGRHPLVA